MYKSSPVTVIRPKWVKKVSSAVEIGGIPEVRVVDCDDVDDSREGVSLPFDALLDVIWNIHRIKPVPARRWATIQDDDAKIRHYHPH